MDTPEALPTLIQAQHTIGADAHLRSNGLNLRHATNRAIEEVHRHVCTLPVEQQKGVGEYQITVTVTALVPPGLDRG